MLKSIWHTHTRTHAQQWNNKWFRAWLCFSHWLTRSSDVSEQWESGKRVKVAMHLPITTSSSTLNGYACCYCGPKYVCHNNNVTHVCVVGHHAQMFLWDQNELKASQRRTKCVLDSKVCLRGAVQVEMILSSTCMTKRDAYAKMVSLGLKRSLWRH